MTEFEDFLLETNETPIPGEMEFNVRIIKGEFAETVIGFANLKVDSEDEEEDEYLLKYDYAIRSSPDPDLKEENEGLQKVTGEILYQLISNAVMNEAERLQNERQSTTDNS